MAFPLWFTICSDRWQLCGVFLVCTLILGEMIQFWFILFKRVVQPPTRQSCYFPFRSGSSRDHFRTSESGKNFHRWTSGWNNKFGFMMFRGLFPRNMSRKSWFVKIVIHMGRKKWWRFASHDFPCLFSCEHIRFRSFISFSRVTG